MCMASTAYFKGGKKHDSRAELAKEIVPPLFQMWGTIKSISVWGDEIQSLVQYSIKTDVEAKIIFMGPPPVPRWSQKWGALSPILPGCAGHDHVCTHVIRHHNGVGRGCRGSVDAHPTFTLGDQPIHFAPPIFTHWLSQFSTELLKTCKLSVIVTVHYNRSAINLEVSLITLRARAWQRIQYSVLLRPRMKGYTYMFMWWEIYCFY